MSLPPGPYTWVHTPTYSPHTAVQGVWTLTMNPTTPAEETPVEEAAENVGYATADDVQFGTPTKYTVQAVSVDNGSHVEVKVDGYAETRRELGEAVLHATRTTRDAVVEYWTDTSTKDRAGA